MAPDPIIRGLILAAGFGTRLAPITGHVPKPLLPVGNATLLDHAVAAFDGVGIREIAVNSHHLGAMIGEHIRLRADASRFTVFPETVILGTGGALYGAREFLGEADYFVVFNGDVLCDVDLTDLINAHLKNKGLATLLLVDRPQFNTVHLGADGSIIHFQGAGPLTSENLPDDGNALTYCGIGVFSRCILDDIGPGFSSLIAPLVRGMVADPGCVNAFVSGGFFWDDLGTLSRLLEVSQGISEHSADFAWLQKTLDCNNLPLKMTRITGHGSDRHFWRLATSDWSAIAMQSPPDDQDFPHQVAIANFLQSHDLGSATVLSADEDAKVMLMEDLGQASLYLLARNPGTPKRMLVDRYRQVVDHLLRLQSFTDVAKAECPLAVERCLDEETLLWETAYFLENFLKGHLQLPKGQWENLASEFEALAGCVAGQPLVLLHRDFQSQNIHFRDGKVRLVDIQGLRLGPLGYDIMSLVMDPYVALPVELTDELLDRFASGCDLPPGEVRQMALAAGLQRLMQALGAYGFLGHRKGKVEFLTCIPQAVANLQFLLEQLAGQPAERSRWIPKPLGHLTELILSLEC